MNDMANYRGGRVTEARVPLRRGDINTSEHMRGGRHIKGVKTMAAPTSKKNIPHDPVLDKKMKRVKLNKDIIIKSELFNRQ
jgi:hypothetical protein